MSRNHPSFPLILLILTLLLPSISRPHHARATADVNNDRKTLEIIIGGGGGGGDESPPPSPEPENCPLPPPPPPCPPPPRPPPPPKPSPPPPAPPRVTRPQPPRPPLSPFIRKAIPVIQRFRGLIECDPKDITRTWNGTDVCADDKYVGFDCAIYPGTKDLAVASVRFNEFNFSGKNLRLDNFLDKLEEVTIFHANSNQFVGSVPRVENLKYLFELDLSNNKLSGEFPSSVLQAKNLTFLDLRFNSLSGSVPPQVFNLDVDVLFINNNNLVQRLPDNLGSITALYLTFANNRFTGQIPSSIGNIKYLQEVLFLNNALTGCLPYEIGKLNQATVFDVGFNQLTGPIPYSFGCLGKMEQLNLARNKFYGAVPEIVCDLPRIQNLSLSYNYFTQVGPKCRELIKKRVLDVRMNCILDLPNQRSPDDCAKFFMRKESCPNPESVFWMPCSKSPYRLKPGRGSPPGLPSPPPSVSYNALNTDRVRNL
ncbi:PREDICTED: uncharacterized protein At4g06744-like [Tarenaya hassleriana]|uniref:uncharacterized protein At4g06744-like n=1 Tax=Tarenaya hassleriana TaxID=28532 RepID=UPI00053C28C5|nr:PREDICTED: uncharacterized protein At4g06744-like [Tarenaya hassleriana]